MNPKVTPQEIRTITESLTSLKTVGVVEKLTQAKGEAYKLRVPEGFLVTLRESTGWIVTLFGHDGRAVLIWSDIPTEKTQIDIQLIDLFFKTDGERSVNPVFKKSFMDAKHDVERKTYSSDLGDMTIHSRRHRVGTELVIEVVDEGLFLRCLWERSTGAIDPRSIQELPSSPF